MYLCFLFIYVTQNNNFIYTVYKYIYIYKIGIFGYMPQKCIFVWHCNYVENGLLNYYIKLVCSFKQAIIITSHFFY